MNKDCYVLLQKKWQAFKKFVSVCNGSLQYINITFWWDLSLQFILQVKIFVIAIGSLKRSQAYQNLFFFSLLH